ncbi:hypothetical protein IV203_037137 [Nitzschia inconspicua]|uniref:Uncharacterized protein n=1 Tax=Nitzschia inconspicua TaxID=303405 RepID=A0A9K3LK68_9STRA|nr:hypothetical protein IV203_037137 [Nitzschia inconspicua]
MECESPFKRQRKTVATSLNVHRLDASSSRYGTYCTSSYPYPPTEIDDNIAKIDHHYHHSVSIDSTIDSLKQAFTTQQRVCTLQTLLQQLRYDPSTKSCYCSPNVLSRLLQTGFVPTLCFHLASCLHNGDGDRFSSTQVIELLLQALDVAYRYIPELVHEEALTDDHRKDLLKFLPKIYQQAQYTFHNHQSAMHHNRSNNHGLTTSLILSIWHSISSSSLGSSLLLQRPETLPLISEMLSIEQRHAAAACEKEIIMAGLGLLKNLTFYGEDHRHSIVEHTDLVSTLSSLTNSPNDKTVERLSAIFRNLALSSDVRLKMAQRSDVLTALAVMVGKSIMSGDEENENNSKHILRNALSTLSNLAIETSATNLLLFHGDGILIKQLAKILLQVDDTVVRKRSIKTLRLLARDTATVSPMMILLQNHHLLEILSNCAMYDSNDGVRMEAQEAFAKCATLIRSPMEQYQSVLDALTHMTVKTIHNIPSSSADVVTRALREQASHPENRLCMGRRTELIEGLAKILSSASTSQLAKENVCATFLDLSKDPVNHLSLASPVILGALVGSLLDVHAQVSNEIASTTSRRVHLRESIVRCLLNLSQTPDTWKTMASQTSLLQSLLQFASNRSTDPNLKTQVKNVILRLAAEL